VGVFYLRVQQSLREVQPDVVRTLTEKECQMKIAMLALIGIGAVVAWPIAKDAAIDKAVATFMNQSTLSEKINKSDAGPIGNMFAYGLAKGIASQAMSEQDIGTQILVVFRVLVLNDVPAVPNIN
jgi:hypothetical protein